MWDLRQSVGLPLAEHLSHFAKYGIPDDDDDGVAMAEYFVQVLVADDNDGNLDNGTPHYAAIAAAFNAHGIGTSLFINISHEPLEDQPAAGPYPLTAVITYTGPGGIDVSNTRVQYSVNGSSFVSTPLRPDRQRSVPGLDCGPAGIDRALLPHGSRPERRQSVASGECADLDLHLPGGRDRHRRRPRHGVRRRMGSGRPSGQRHDRPLAVGGARGEFRGQRALSARSGSHALRRGVLRDPEPDRSQHRSRRLRRRQRAHHALHQHSRRLTHQRRRPPVLEYYRWYTNDLGNAPGSDLWRVDISNNGGATWVPVEATTASNNSWQRVVFFIGDYVTPRRPCGCASSPRTWGTPHWWRRGWTTCACSTSIPTSRASERGSGRSGAGARSPGAEPELGRHASDVHPARARAGDARRLRRIGKARAGDRARHAGAGTASRHVGWVRRTGTSGGGRALLRAARGRAADPHAATRARAVAIRTARPW